MTKSNLNNVNYTYAGLNLVKDTTKDLFVKEKNIINLNSYHFLPFVTNYYLFLHLKSALSTPTFKNNLATAIGVTHINRFILRLRADLFF
jgi:hypothetical protein